MTICNAFNSTFRTLPRFVFLRFSSTAPRTTQLTSPSPDTYYSYSTAMAAVAVIAITTAGHSLRGAKRPLGNLLLLSRGFSSSTTTTTIKAEDLRHGVSRTSIGTAMMRAVEQNQPHPLFHDPFAATLAGNEGDAMMGQFEDALKRSKNAPSQSAAGFLTSMVVKPDTLLRAMQAMVPVRHKFFDDYVLNSLHDIQRQQRSTPIEPPPLQFVNTACGLDSRAFRLVWPQHTRVYEIDRPEVLSYKAGKLETVGAKPSCAARYVVEADVVTDPWEQRLLDQGFDASLPSVWLAEGLLPYLPEPEVSRLLQRMRAISAPGSFVGADHPATRLAKSHVAERLMLKLQDMKAPLISSTDDPEGLLRSCGWDSPDVTFLGEKRAHYGRWPFPAVSAFIPASFMPRFWLMTAKATR